MKLTNRNLNYTQYDGNTQKLFSASIGNILHNLCWVKFYDDKIKLIFATEAVKCPIGEDITKELEENFCGSFEFDVVFETFVGAPRLLLNSLYLLVKIKNNECVFKLRKWTLFISRVSKALLSKKLKKNPANARSFLLSCLEFKHPVYQKIVFVISNYSAIYKINEN